jgi:choline-sulfatase
MKSHAWFSAARQRLILGLSVATLVFAPPAEGKAPPADQPDILFIFADDYCFDAIHALGDPVVQTPNLDRLMARGTTFTHAYNMGSWSPAVCVASRAMLVTGRSVWNAQKAHRVLDQERAAGRLWPQLLSRAGYRTYMTGKWHLPVDPAQTFDHARNVFPGMPKDFPAGYGRPVDGQPDPWNPADPKWGGYWEGGRHWSEITADDTIGFISDAQSHHQAVFIYSAFNAPHDPRQAPQADLDRYPLERIRVPVSALPEYPYAEAMGAGRTLRDERLAPFPRTEQAIRTQIREYYALITHLDAQLGRIFAALEASGRAGRTWIFFTADNGLAVGRHGLMGKQSMYEHSLRVPFIVAGPRAAANRRIATPIYLQDAMATTLALANVPEPAALDFHSLLPLLEDPGHGGFYPDVYGAYLSSQRALVHKGYKLILYPGAKAARLFHLDQDPHEIHDLATAAAHQPTMRRLFARLLDQQRTLADPLDLSPLYPQWAPDPPARP